MSVKRACWSRGWWRLLGEIVLAAADDKEGGISVAESGCCGTRFIAPS
jgi:hypothetical protein